MKKFRNIFYAIYILTVLVVLYFCIDIILHKAAYIEKLSYTTIKKLPTYTIVLLLFLCVLMIIEFILESAQIMSLRRQLTNREKEVLALKAKLYDKAEEEKSKEVSEDPETDGEKEQSE